MAKFAVVLAGCGVFDGAEIQESICTLISIKKHGSEYVCFSLNKPQHQVIDHITQKVVEEKRNILIESGRISRGDIKDISAYDPKDFDAVVFPGGFGVAKNFFTFARDGADCEIDEQIRAAILATHKARKYIGAMCVAPGLIIRAFKGTGIRIRVTGGNEKGLVEAIKQMGGENVKCPVNLCVTDQNNRVVTTPAYTSAKNVFEVFQGVEAMISSILQGLGN